MVWRLQLRKIQALSARRAPISSSLARLSGASTSDGCGRQSATAATSARPRVGGTKEFGTYSSGADLDRPRIKSQKGQIYVPNSNVVNIQKCSSIEQSIQAANSCLNRLSPRDLDSVWRHMLSLAKRNRNAMNKSQTHQLEALFNHTVRSIETCQHADLSFIAYTFAQIIKTNREWNSLLLNPSFWNIMYQRSIVGIERLGTQALVNIAWSYATITQPMFMARTPMNTSTFYEALLPVFLKRKNSFNSNNIANLAWACMTCRVANPALFKAMADEFTSRRKQEDEGKRGYEDLSIITICQIANSFAKAGYKDVMLFQSISDCAIPLLSSFEPRNFANLAHSFATAGMNPECEDGGTLMDEIENECIRKLGKADSQNLANLVWAYATLNHQPDQLFDAIADVARGRLEEFAPQHLCNVAWGFSKYSPSTEIFDDIAREVVSRGLDSFTPQGLAILANSFATAGCSNKPEFWNSIERAAVQKSSQFGGIECARIAWSFATIERSSKDLFAAIAKVVIDKMDDYTFKLNSQGLANLAWAFSLMECESKELFDAVAARCVQQINYFKPQEMTMLLLAYSRLNDHSYPRLYEQIIIRSLPQLEKFALLDLFNMAISYAKVGYIHEQWMVAIADEILRRKSLDHHTMHTGMLWAYATARISRPDILEFLTASLLNNMHVLTGENMASIAWSLASLECHHKPLFDALAEASNQTKVKKMNAQSLTNLAWAYAKARDNRPALFNEIANEAMTRDDFAPQGISNILWAFATTAHLNEPLFVHLALHAKESLDEFNSQALSNIAWSYTVADIDSKSLFGDKSFVNKCIEKLDEFDSQGLSQLHQWNVWRKQLHSNHLLPEPVALHCQRALAEQVDVYKSRLQKDVMSELKEMNLPISEEVKLQSGYFLDGIVEIDETKFGIEVDGPTHFIGRVPDGGTILKHRQVTSVDGVELISIPYWEWNELKTQEDRHQYLRSRLRIESFE